MLTKTEFSLKLDEDLEDLRGIKGRCFSDEEYQKRWHKVKTNLEDTKLDSLIIYGAERAGSAIPWLTGWPVSAEALLIISLDWRLNYSFSIIIIHRKQNPQHTVLLFPGVGQIRHKQC